MYDNLNNAKFASFIAAPVMQFVPPTFDMPEITIPATLGYNTPAYTVQPISEAQPEIVIDGEEAEMKPEKKKQEKPKSKNNRVSPVGQKVVELARQFVGQPYVWGGKSPKQGFDCSGLIGWVYNQVGIKIPFSTYGQFQIGEKVSLENAQVGDIICTPGSGASGRHVKMISKIDENGQIYTIEAKGRKWGIVESPLKKTNNIISIRRVTGS